MSTTTENSQSFPIFLDPGKVSNIGQTMIDIRKELGMSKLQFDALLGLSRGTVQRYEDRQWEQCTMALIQGYYEIAYDAWLEHIAKK